MLFFVRQMFAQAYVHQAFGGALPFGVNEHDCLRCPHDTTQGMGRNWVPLGPVVLTYYPITRPTGDGRMLMLALALIPRPILRGMELQSTTSDRSHAIGFYCRLTCGGSTFSNELGPSRNTSIHASETECSPGSLTLCLAKRATRSVAVDLRNDLRGVETPT